MYVATINVLLGSKEAVFYGLENLLNGTKFSPLIKEYREEGKGKKF